MCGWLCTCVCVCLCVCVSACLRECLCLCVSVSRLLQNTTSAPSKKIPNSTSPGAYSQIFGSKTLYVNVLRPLWCPGVCYLLCLVFLATVGSRDPEVPDIFSHSYFVNVVIIIFNIITIIVKSSSSSPFLWEEKWSSVAPIPGVSYIFHKYFPA